MNIKYWLQRPTVEYCEKAGNGFIKRPFYAIGNLVYLAVGLLILKKGNGSKISKLFGYMSLFIGIYWLFFFHL